MQFMNRSIFVIVFTELRSGIITVIYSGKKRSINHRVPRLFAISDSKIPKLVVDNCETPVKSALNITMLLSKYTYTLIKILFFVSRVFS